MLAIYTHNDTIAYTAENAPGFTKDDPANESQLNSRCEGMNKMAEEMGLKVRYDVRS